MAKRYLHQPLSHYGEPIKTIGQGGYGEVIVYRNMEGKSVAVKFSKAKDKGAKVAPLSQAFIKEMSYLLSFKHPNVVSAIDVGITEGDERFYIVMELANNDATPTNIKNKNPDVLKKILFDITSGIGYLTSRGIIHGDIKPQNILMVNEPNEGIEVAKVADFGISETLYCTKERENKNILYTRYYRPPEVILGITDITPQSDVWALGCTFYEIITGKVLFSDMWGEAINIALNSITKKLGPISEMSWPEVVNARWWKEYEKIDYKSNLEWLLKLEDPVLIDLISGMMRYNPVKRYTIYEVLEHPYFSQLNLPSDIKPISCKTLLDNIHPRIENFMKQDLRLKFLSTIFQLMVHYRSTFEDIFLGIVLFEFVVSEVMKTEKLTMSLANEIAFTIIYLAYSQHSEFLSMKDLLDIKMSEETIRNTIFLSLSLLNFNTYHSTPLNYLETEGNKVYAKLNADSKYFYLYVLYLLIPNMSYEEMARCVRDIKNETMSPEQKGVLRSLLEGKGDQLKGLYLFKNRDVYNELMDELK